MGYWLAGIIFFFITFGPRFYSFMNYGFGFSDLGLYSQFLAALSHNNFNPFIPSWGKEFFKIKSQPILVLLYPLSKFSISPVCFLFLDEISIFMTAAVCARHSKKSGHPQVFNYALFFAVLFSQSYFSVLHGAARMTLWAQIPLALLVSEFFLKRRILFLFTFSTLLIALDLNFWILGVALGVMSLITRSNRWNFKARVLTSAPILVPSILGFLASGGFIFDRELFFQIHQDNLLNWFIGFWFLPLLCPEMLIAAFLALGVRLSSSFHDPSILIPLGAIGSSMVLVRLKIRDDWLVKLFSSGLVATAIYLNLISSDPFFSFWKNDRWIVTENSTAISNMVAKISPQNSVAANDFISPHLAFTKYMISLGATGPGSPVDYVLSVHESTHYDRDPRYTLVESHSSSGARLLHKIK